MTDKSTEVQTENYEEREAKAVADGKANMSKAFFSDSVGKKGLFADMKDFDPEYHQNLLLSNDGGGTKVLLPVWMDRFDTVGIDVVAMNANDLATFGAITKAYFNAYFAVQAYIEEHKMGEIVRGIDEGLKQCVPMNGSTNVNYGKFETASVDELVHHFDMSISAAAFIEKSLLPTFDPKPGDIIVGFRSSGLHCNGYTAARHELLTSAVEPRPEWKSQYRGPFTLDDMLPESDLTVGEALLAPTEIYMRDMILISQAIPGTYGINITGYGLKNFNRFGNNVVYRINQPLVPNPIDRVLVQKAGYSTEKAYTKFNMGMGFAVIVKNSEEATTVCRIADEEGHEARVVGYVDERKEERPLTILEPGLGDSGPSGKVVLAEFEGYD